MDKLTDFSCHQLYNGRWQHQVRMTSCQFVIKGERPGERDPDERDPDTHTVQDHCVLGCPGSFLQDHFRKSLSLLSIGVAPIAIALLASGMKPYRERMEASSG